MTALTAVTLVLTLVGAGLMLAGFFREPLWAESAIVWSWVAAILWWRGP